MACVHNQAKIDDLNDQIKKKQTEITGLKSNIEICEDIKKKHENFNKKIDCVINNLEGNTVVAGVSYDNGKMSECLKTSNDTITDCGNIILESNKKILLLEKEILSLEHTISTLQGNCALCLVEEEEI